MSLHGALVIAQRWNYLDEDSVATWELKLVWRSSLLLSGHWYKILIQTADKRKISSFTKMKCTLSSGIARCSEIWKTRALEMQSTANNDALWSMQFLRLISKLQKVRQNDLDQLSSLLMVVWRSSPYLTAWDTKDIYQIL